MPTMTFRSLPSLLFILCCSAGSAQPFDPVLAAGLQFTIDSMRTANNLKGISACVMLADGATWKGVSGVSHAGTPITPDMEFGIGSNTKLFTGVLLLKLAENGLLDLDDALGVHLPAMANIDPAITIRQLLNHTSGVADVISVPGYPDSILTDPERLFAPGEVISWIGPPQFAPGMGWSYCNTNYLLAGLIAESATGQVFGQLLRDSILSPLELDSIFLDVHDSVLYTVAHPWQGGVDNAAVPRRALNSAAWASGAMYATAGEMVQWYHALMGGQVLAPASFSDMTTFVGSGNYGVGLYGTQVLGRTVWQHGGTIWGGYNSSMFYDTATGSVICVLVNQNPAQAFPIARQLLSDLISLPLPTGGHEAAKPTSLIHPNPAQDMVRVEVPGRLTGPVRVIGATGELVRISAGTAIPLSGLAPGPYIIRVPTDRGICTHRLIKE
jgi:D-alanyl-D-alanine carboxypeptidase